ncbi:MAG TPA: DegT/DnrJ/EryC1/StrS family aminotransferase [Baekduia sp.]|nr:DegT/DnrJ/EryC1/StrS family aminotransferase [Baekduia sp.]
MSGAFLPYGRQEIDERDIDAVVSALREPLITQGPRVDAFEAAFAAAHGAPHAVAFANGTAALHAAMAVSGAGPGDEVLTTPMSFVASSNCALFVGARPRFADIDPQTANLDTAAAVRDGLADGVRAVVAVSLAGHPVDLGPLQALRERGVTVIEDAAHAVGAARAEEPVGAGGLADLTCFSLHPVKTMTTGEGGIVTTASADLAERLRRFRTHGMVRREDPCDPLLGPWHYDVDELGFNYRVTDFQCALGLSQLERLRGWIAARNAIAARYHELLGGTPGLSLPAPAPPGAVHGRHLFVVRFTEGPRRRRAMAESLRARGIGTQLHYIPIPLHGLYRRLGHGPEAMTRLPNTQAYYEQALSLPMYPGLTDADVRRVAAAVVDLLAEPLPR